MLGLVAHHFLVPSLTVSKQRQEDAHVSRERVFVQTVAQRYPHTAHQVRSATTLLPRLAGSTCACCPRSLMRCCSSGGQLRRPHIPRSWMRNSLSLRCTSASVVQSGAGQEGERHWRRGGAREKQRSRAANRHLLLGLEKAPLELRVCTYQPCTNLYYT